MAQRLDLASTAYVSSGIQRSPIDVVPNVAGSFQIAGVLATNAIVQVSGLAPPFYVKSIRFDGVASGDGRAART